MEERIQSNAGEVTHLKETRELEARVVTETSSFVQELRQGTWDPRRDSWIRIGSSLGRRRNQLSQRR
jgi:hypothetical protein